MQTEHLLLIDFVMGQSFRVLRAAWSCMQNEYLTQPSARYIHALERLLMQVLVTETRKAQSGALIAGQEHSNLMQQQHCHLLCCSTVSAAVFTSVDQLLVQTKCYVAHSTHFKLNLSNVSLSPLCVLFTIKKKWPIVLQWNLLCSHGCLWFPDYSICLSSLSLSKIFQLRNVFGLVSRHFHDCCSGTL